MNDNYSIELKAKEIKNPKTFEYFKEVWSSYSLGNNRSAVVMLWSVVVCDLFFKLTELKELYDDEVSASILEDIEIIRKKNPRSSDWEIKLLDMVENKTQLLDSIEKDAIALIQKERHLAAHPILKNKSILHRPNSDMVRSLIRSALDYLLTKSPILSKDIFNDLLKDIESVAPIIHDNARLESYLNDRYFNHLSPSSESYIFKGLWKLVFRTTDDECNRNRIINYKALKILYQKKPNNFDIIIENEKSYFSNIADSSNATLLKYLISFLSSLDLNRIYNLLNDSAKSLLTSYVEGEFSQKCIAWFINHDKEEHLNVLISEVEDNKYNVENSAWLKMKNIYAEPSTCKLLARLASTYYGLSSSYNHADSNFLNSIEPLLDLFDYEEFEFLLNKIENNTQTFERSRAKIDHKIIYEFILRKFPEFDFKNFNSFTKFINI